ncbi:hypothetical protein AZI86_12485 [Bdellovibrio bacteriovorus]|uniref:HipA protein n=1 Tax=Bdellovibrio bacteriovorus TaxID=959 RepID=A0A150WIU7_BDEBC|nr:HipA domain-containing protein [Bdellovibrio bacteriovorus]KYG63642.1 hypothetical protein AZI86_12485 [Bdellovibrio bacteriovorus]
MVNTKSGIPPHLGIIYEGKEVGELSFDLVSEKFQLFYLPSWLKEGFALSPHLPLFAEFPAENIKKFLENLLPEEDGLTKFAELLRISKSNIFGLLQAMGQDTTGAFSFTAGDSAPPTSFRAISKEELTERVLNRANKPIAMWDGKPRLSLAGVQEKLGITIKQGEYGFGEGKLASTHILKFSKKGQNLVLNEFFCMKLAKAVGLPVAEVEIVNFGERVLQVERFDRRWKSDEHVARMHVIDGCQALNVSPSFKYQRMIPVGPHKDSYLSPINVENLSKFNQSCRVPAKAQLQLLRWILFNLIIGNVDNHGKNISYFVTQKGYEIAPAYDLVSVTMYADFNQEMAFKVGDAFNLGDVGAFQLAEMAQEMNLPPALITTQLKKLCSAILKNVDDIVISDLNSEESNFMATLKDSIKIRIEHFSQQASLIKSISKSL